MRPFAQRSPLGKAPLLHHLSIDHERADCINMNHMNCHYNISVRNMKSDALHAVGKGGCVVRSGASRGRKRSGERQDKTRAGSRQGRHRAGEEDVRQSNSEQSGYSQTGRAGQGRAEQGRAGQGKPGRALRSLGLMAEMQRVPHQAKPLIYRFCCGRHVPMKATKNLSRQHTGSANELRSDSILV